MNDLPVILKLTGRQCLIVGGGKVALRRAQALVSVGACVTVVAPHCDPGFASDCPEVTCHQRGFEDADLDGVFLVVIATDDKAINDHVNRLADAGNVLVNRVDDPAAGNMSIPAHAHCGPITIAVHTNRISASAAATIRDTLLDHVDPAWPALLSAMAPFRQQLQEKVSDTFIRQKALKRMADEQAMTLIKEQGVIHYIKYCETLMAQFAGDSSNETVTESESE